MGKKYDGVKIYNIPTQVLIVELRKMIIPNQLGFKFKVEQPYNNGVIVKYSSGVSFTSWGEDIEVNLFDCHNGTTQVSIHSECTVVTQIVDYGRNKKNVESFFQGLDSFAYYYQMQGSAQTQPVQAPVAPVQQVVNADVKFCSACGNKMTADALFCNACGQKFSE